MVIPKFFPDYRFVAKTIQTTLNVHVRRRFVERLKDSGVCRETTVGNEHGIDEPP